MKLKKIYIQNFGIYKGSYEYDFSVTENKNVVLISGRNGSGKTTLLNVAKLSIYGPKIFGFKTEQNNRYLSYIRSNLNAFALHEGDHTFKIGIDFELFHDNQLKDFSIKRSWIVTQDSLKESTSLFVNGEQLSTEDEFAIFDYIHRNVPKTLFDLFFFDGEKISEMFMLKSDLSEMLNHVYNLNLFLKLKLDLKKYKSQASVSKELTDQQRLQIELNEKLENLDTSIETTQKVLDTQKKELAQLEDILKNKNEEFQALGGLNNEQQIEIKNKISKLQEQKNILDQYYKHLIEFMPFIMLTPQINEIVKVVEQEKNSKNLKIISDCLTSVPLLNHLNNQFNEFETNKFILAIQEFTSSQVTKTLLYDLSPNDERELLNVWDSANELTGQDVGKVIEEIQNINKEILKANKKLEEATHEDLKHHLEEVTALSDSIGMIKKEVETLTIELSQLKTEKSNTEDELIKLKAQIKATLKESNIGNIVDKVDTIIVEYCHRLKKQKQKELESTISAMFTKLIRKDDFIKEIKIDENSGEILLFNRLGGILPKENLSAGEKQIYILSILFGIITLSKNKVPLVFDTLLGRLDHAHKTHIVKSFIKECSEQVIILATDTEIDEQYFNILKPLINNYYKIDYDSANNCVKHEKSNLE